MSRRPPIDADTRETALRWLRAGAVSLPELAELLGTSTQTIWNWCREAGIDWRKARKGRLVAEWCKVQRHGPKLGERSKPGAGPTRPLANFVASEHRVRNR